MQTRLHQLFDNGQAIWCDNLSRRMLKLPSRGISAAGTDPAESLAGLINLGVVGVTSNPTIFMKAITGGNDYDERMRELVSKGLGRQDLLPIYEGLVLPDIADAADLLRPVYEATDGLDGYVSLEVDPRLAFETGSTIDEARRLFRELDRPNIFIKVPATKEGIPAIQTLIGEGINVNVTLIFSVQMYEEVMQAYLNGLSKLHQSGGNLRKVASVASFFVSRVDTLVDKLLEDCRAAGEQSDEQVDELLGRTAIANTKLAYRRFEEVFGSGGAFDALKAAGARVQRPLWASTSTKNPAYPDTIYVDNLVGEHTVNTLPPATIKAAIDHGGTAITIRDGVDEAKVLFDRLAKLGINMDEVTQQLTVEGVDSFVASFEQLLDDLKRKLSPTVA